MNEGGGLVGLSEGCRAWPVSGLVDEGLDNLGGAVVEEPPEADGEDELSVEGVFEAGDAGIAGALPGIGKNESGDEGEEGGDGIEKEGVGPTEEEGVDAEHGASVSEEGLIALHEVDSEEEMLGEDGEKRVEEENEEPEGGAFAGETKEEFGPAEGGEKDEKKGGGEDAENDFWEVSVCLDPASGLLVFDAGIKKAEEEGEA